MLDTAPKIISAATIYTMKKTPMSAHNNTAVVQYATLSFWWIFHAPNVRTSPHIAPNTATGTPMNSEYSLRLTDEHENFPPARLSQKDWSVSQCSFTRKKDRKIERTPSIPMSWARCSLVCSTTSPILTTPMSVITKYSVDCKFFCKNL